MKVLELLSLKVYPHILIVVSARYINGLVFALSCVLQTELYRL